MDLGLKDKVALVTGAGSQIGFGKGIVMALANEGCNIIAADIDLDGAKKTAAEVEALGCKAMAIKCDITDRSSVNEMITAGLEKMGKIDILVNNAGNIMSLKPVHERTDDEIDRDISLNLRGMINCCKAVIDHMLSRKSGKIVSIASIGASHGKPRTSSYGAAKAGVIGFSLSLAVEVAEHGINVNCVSPGLGLTGFAGGNPPPDMVEMALKKIPVKRSTTPQDIGNVVAFLASDVSSDMTGQTLHVDGGESIA
jgi:NAD(P)-dependent dehydrogenase (short-subunit alcohol dehydrogenase family)